MGKKTSDNGEIKYVKKVCSPKTHRILKFEMSNKDISEFNEKQKLALIKETFKESGKSIDFAIEETQGVLPGEFGERHNPCSHL